MADGLDLKVQLRSYRKELSGQIVKVAKDDMDAAGRFLLERAQELVPVRTGKLRDSGIYKVRKKSVKVSFGDKKGVVPYAYSIHENVRNRTVGGRGPKYIERAGVENFNELQEKMTDRLARIKAVR